MLIVLLVWMMNRLPQTKAGPGIAVPDSPDEPIQFR
jgi:hypothetical protein